MRALLCYQLRKKKKKKKKDGMWGCLCTLLTWSASVAEADMIAYDVLKLDPLRGGDALSSY